MKYVPLAMALLLSSDACSSTQDEIDHLLSFVESTKCQYERNGTLHSGDEAVKHIKSKADHYADKIHSTEDFIAYSATQSILSGRYYQVHCEGLEPITSEVWLKNELADFRAK
ncbi:hypothetical protein C9980_22720 [Vibrio mediterranei]|uniref:DUF5329 family protein n=1 Tax=Vibrio mediterranei TaxID=689 RepID=UPI000D18485F|nr:DUF5329 family protein [Vibrio mediterranei]PTC02596.1 hypothetical protein C9980_22720 [Vibrio mediterranei]